MRRRWLFLTVFLAFSITVAAQGRGNGANKSNNSRPSAPDQSNRGSNDRSNDRLFTQEHARIIREWFASPANLRGLPPGLAKKEQLPPGLQRQLVRNGTPPPGLDKKIQPFPPQLEARLPRLSGGWIRVVLGRNVMVIDVNTHRILDLLTDVF